MRNKNRAYKANIGQFLERNKRRNLRLYIYHSLESTFTTLFVWKKSTKIGEKINIKYIIFFRYIV
jgi:hypothetical protein